MVMFLMSFYDLMHAGAMVAAITLSWHGVCYAAAVFVLAMYLALRYRVAPPDWQVGYLALLFIALGLLLQSLGQ